eukprot:6212651-Pleurochrysis_carterae.AAC.2
MDNRGLSAEQQLREQAAELRRLSRHAAHACDARRRDAWARAWRRGGENAHACVRASARVRRCTRRGACGCVRRCACVGARA